MLVRLAVLEQAERGGILDARGRETVGGVERVGVDAGPSVTRS